MSAICFSTAAQRIAVRPSAVPARQVAAPRSMRASHVIMRAEIPGDNKAVQQALKDAEAACKDGNSAECITAWDQVEEVSAAVNDKKNEVKSNDPMEKFCENNEDADECRVYDN